MHTEGVGFSQGLVDDIDPDVVGTILIEWESRIDGYATDSIDGLHAKGSSAIASKGHVGSNVFSPVIDEAESFLAESGFNGEGKIRLLVAETESEEEGARTILGDTMGFKEATGKIISISGYNCLGGSNGGDIPRARGRIPTAFGFDRSSGVGIKIFDPVPARGNAGDWSHRESRCYGRFSIA